jgi:hypothetical protein
MLMFLKAVVRVGLGGGAWKNLIVVIEAKTLSQLAKWMSHRPRS